MTDPMEHLEFLKISHACLRDEDPAVLTKKDVLALVGALKALQRKSEADSALWHEMEERLAALEQYIGDEK